jgi:uncharacterized protein DUF3833
MNAMHILLPAAAASFLCIPAGAAAETTHPMRFFEGRTEGWGVMRVMLKKPYRTRSIGRGHFERDGSLSLIQRVEDEGQPTRERRWKIRQISPHRFSGTMSEAMGPVTIDEIGGRYRFRFKMKGNLSVEQWLAPIAGGKSARNRLTIRKFGMTVGSGEGVIRKVVASAAR